MRGQVLTQNGDIITVKLFDELTPEMKREYRIGKNLFVNVELFDPESITQAQRNHIYALIGDMENYTGYPAEAWESHIKINFMHKEFMQDFPSLRNNQMTKKEASRLIEYIVIYCIQNGIPFRNNREYLPKDTMSYIFYATMNRNCVICGKPNADIHHIDAVGMGRNRKKIDHTNKRVIALCWTHHNEAHNIGVKEFFKKYIIQPVKLNEKQLKELGVM